MSAADRADSKMVECLRAEGMARLAAVLSAGREHPFLAHCVSAGAAAGKLARRRAAAVWTASGFGHSWQLAHAPLCCQRSLSPSGRTSAALGSYQSLSGSMPIAMAVQLPATAVGELVRGTASNIGACTVVQTALLCGPSVGLRAERMCNRDPKGRVFSTSLTEPRPQRMVVKWRSGRDKHAEYTHVRQI